MLNCIFFLLKLIESLNKFLPSINIINPKNEIDYYGFSYFLSNKLNLNYNYSFSSWVHGWIFNEIIYKEQFNTAQYSPNYKIVANMTQKKFLEDSGFKKVVTASYPYVYVDKVSGINRYKNSLLIMTPKNSVDTFDIINEEEYIDSIKEYKKDFEEIFFCIDQISFNNNLWVKKLQENKIKFIVGAHSNDMNSLIRTKVIFQHFEYVHSPVIGSAVVYAAIDGCKVSLSENYLEYKIDNYKNHPLYESNRKYIEYEIYTKSKKYIKDKFGFLFKEPLDSEKNIEWSKRELAIENKVNLQEISQLLGWRFRDKIKYYPLKILKK